VVTISKRALVQLFTLALGGVGLALVVGVLVGNQLAQPDAVEAAAHATLPVASSGPATAPLECELAPVGAPEDRARLDEIAREERGGSSNSGTNSATNSGTIEGSQFSDGGFGDIGQQWWNVVVGGDVTNVHISGTGNVVATNDAVVTLPPAVEPSPSPVDQVPTSTTAAPPMTTTPATTQPPAPSTAEPTTTTTTEPTTTDPATRLGD
jgi:hypothetical protein